LGSAGQRFATVPFVGGTAEQKLVTNLKFLQKPSKNYGNQCRRNANNRTSYGKLPGRGSIAGTSLADGIRTTADSL